MTPTAFAVDNPTIFFELDENARDGAPAGDDWQTLWDEPQAVFRYQIRTLVIVARCLYSEGGALKHNKSGTQNIFRAWHEIRIINLTNYYNYLLQLLKY